MDKRKLTIEPKNSNTNAGYLAFKQINSTLNSTQFVISFQFLIYIP